MKVIITESQLKSIIISEQQEYPGSHSSDNPGYDDYEVTGKEPVLPLNQHDVNSLVGTALDFIPVVGPFLGMAVSAGDAYMYHKEGNDKMATISLFLGALPALTAVVKRIPFIAKLGKNGMNVLADKIAKGITKFTPDEIQVVKGINLNKSLVHSEVDGLFKRTLNNVKNNGKNVNSLVNKVAPHVDKAIETGINQGINQGSSKVLDKMLGSSQDALSNSKYRGVIGKPLGGVVTY
jgi:uncharacterized protein (DUF697 family)